MGTVMGSSGGCKVAQSRRVEREITRVSGGYDYIPGT